MGFVNERIAIETKFKVGFADVNGSIQVIYENRETPRPSNVTEWVYLFVIPGYGNQIELGSNPLHRRAGLVQCNIHVPADKGLKRANEIADLIDIVFKNLDLIVGTTGIARFTTSRLKPVGVRDNNHASVLEIPYHVDQY